MNGSEKYIEAIEWCGKLYEFINEKFFESALSKPVITVAPCERNKALGWFVRGEIWQAAENKYTEINISSNFLNRPALEIAETMLHEMCHQYAYVNNIQDCSRSGTYHNKLFQRIGQERRLVVDKVPTIGYAKTSLTENSKSILIPFVENQTFIWRKPLHKGARIKSSSTRKYICPSCEQSVRATKSVNIMCADCDELMICEELENACK